MGPKPPPNTKDIEIINQKINVTIDKNPKGEFVTSDSSGVFGIGAFSKSFVPPFVKL